MIRRVSLFLLVLILGWGSLRPVSVEAVGGVVPPEAETFDGAVQSFAMPDDIATTEYATDEILVSFDPTVDITQTSDQLEENLDAGETTEVTVIENGESTNALAVVAIPESLDVEQALAVAQNTEGVAAAQPNYIYRALDDGLMKETTNNVDSLAVVNDPLVGVETNRQWWLPGVGSLRAWDSPRIAALPGADRSNAATVAVLDSGATLNHRDLSANLDIARAWDAVNDRPLSASYGNGGDIWYHGTFVGGVISAVANNGYQCAGIGYNKVRTLPICVFRPDPDDPSGAPVATTDLLVKGINKVLEYNSAAGATKIRVINMSLGTGYADPALHRVIQRAHDDGVVTVAAAGNSSSSAPVFPSDFEEAISVTSTDKNDVASTFTNHNDAKDICAPGTSIVSLVPTGTGVSNGTSFACPMVAGVAALLLAINPNMTIDELKDVLYRTATDLGPAGKDEYYGWGKLAFEEAIVATLPNTFPNSFVAIIHASADSGMSIDVPGASLADSTPLQIYADNVSGAQRYRFTRESDGFYTITNVNSGKVIDVAAANVNSGTTIQQYVSNGTAAQRWRLDPSPGGTFTLRTKLLSHNVIDIRSGLIANGSRLQLWHNNNTAAQRFTLRQITQTVFPGTYSISSPVGQNVLDIAGASTLNGANAQMWTPNNSLAQKFRLSYDADTGYYTIVALCSNKALDVAAGVMADGTNVQQYDPNGTKAQKWTILQADIGVYTVYSAGGYALDVQGGSSAVGANVWIYSANNTDAQKFRFNAA